MKTLVWCYINRRGSVLRPSYTRQHCCWKLLLATMFPRYFASKFVAKLPDVVTLAVMNNNYNT